MISKPLTEDITNQYYLILTEWIGSETCMHAPKYTAAINKFQRANALVTLTNISNEQQQNIST